MASTNVYEVVNRPRREVLIAVCSDEPGVFRLRLRARPAPVCHWKLDEELEIGRLAARVAAPEAEKAFASALAKPRARGWRLFSCRC